MIRNCPGANERIEEYRAYRARWARERQAARGTAEPQSWGEKQHDIAMRTEGLLYVRMVLDAMHRDLMTASDVSDFLEMKLDYLHDLELAVVARKAPADGRALLM